jgi:hypothetical protein
MKIPKGAPYFDAPGQWDAYLRWNFLVPCDGCGIRKMDDPTRYGLQPDPKFPELWITETLCGNCYENPEK